MTSYRRPLAALITLASLVSASAWAGRDTLVYKFSSVGLDDEQADLPETFARAIARAVHAKVNIVTMDDAASMVGCDPNQRVCLEAMLGQTGANRVIFGGVTRNVTGKLKVVLTIYETDVDKKEATYVLSSENADDAADELLEKADVQLNGEQDPDPGSGSDIEIVPPPRRGGGHDSTPGVSNGTYAVIGVGAAATVVGLGFLVSANNLRNEIASHSTAGVDDLKDIQKLERAGQTRVTIGYGLTGAGLLLGVYGIYRAVHEREPTKKHSDPSTDPRTDDDELENALSVVPIQGGAALTWSGTFQ